MTYISDVAHGKRVVTSRMKRKKFYEYAKNKARAVKGTLGRNVKYMGKKIGSKAYSSAKRIKEEQRSHGGFYRLHKTIKPKHIKNLKQIKYFKRKGKKFIPVYKKSKHKVKIQRVQNNNTFNPFGLDF